MSNLPVNELNTAAAPLDLAPETQVYHLPDWHKLSHPERLGVIRQIAESRGRDPRIARLAVDIIRSKAKPREYKKQAAALLKWVQDPKNFYYINEPGERLQDPIYTLQVKHGDCFAEDTLVLRDDFELVPIQDVKPGMRIWGRDRWSHVEGWVEKGTLPVTEILLNNGSTLRLTEDHKVYVWSCKGSPRGGRRHGPHCATLPTWHQCEKTHGAEVIRIRVSELEPGMRLLQPDRIERDKNTYGTGWTLGTTSRTLAVQYRVLQRMLGRSTSVKWVTAHGGFGQNPICRVGVRSEGHSYGLRVEEIRRSAEEIPTYDIQTDDHYVYLPEADCTVSNCDDVALLLAALLESLRIPWKLVLSGRDSRKQKVRYIEGDKVPHGVTWSHIYLIIGAPAFTPTEWWFAEPTIQGVPLGWDVISGDTKYLPEMNVHRGPTRVNPAPPAPLWHQPIPTNNPSPALAFALGAEDVSDVLAEEYGYSAPSGYGQGYAPLVGGLVAADSVDGTTTTFKRILLGVVTGVGVAVGTQLALAALTSVFPALRRGDR